MKNIITDSFVIPNYNKYGFFLRQIRSFQCRNRSLKKKNILFLKKYWLKFGINFQNRYCDFQNIFYNKNNPIILDIGFGIGESILYAAEKFIKYNILGIEVYLSGIINLIKNICTALYYRNIKIIAHDAVEVLKYMIPEDSISIIQIFFPDPWPKNKHHKRRLITDNFIKIILKKIISGGLLHIITDCILYYNSIINIINSCQYFINISHYYNTNNIVNCKIMTRFSKKADSKKNKIFNLVFQCIK